MIIITNTEYVSKILQACCIRENFIKTCNGMRSSVSPVRERVERIIMEIREDTEPDQYCSKQWIARQKELGLESMVGE